jgi:hypothetical protein
MPHKSTNSALAAFIKALHKEKIEFILIGMMAAVEQGAPMATIDYDFWVNLPERQYVRLLNIIQKQKGTIRARTLYELRDGTQVNAIFAPDGLRSFQLEYKHSLSGMIHGQRARILPLKQVIASKQASHREKDLMALPVLKRTLRLLVKTKSV